MSVLLDPQNEFNTASLMLTMQTVIAEARSADQRLKKQSAAPAMDFNHHRLSLGIVVVVNHGTSDDPKRCRS